jgi:predicted nucleic acid-binding Zn ribbon protein
MSDVPPAPVAGSSPERSAPVGSPQPVCVVCGGPRELRKREACSDKCRAALSRRRRKDAQRTRDEAIRALLETALEKLGVERPCIVERSLAP